MKMLNIRGKLGIVICWLAMVSLVEGAAYAYSSCGSSSALNPANLACNACPSNQVSNLYQTVPMSCQCSAGYTLASNPNSNACTAAFTTTCTTSNSYYPVYALTGSAASTADCLACSSVAYTNKYLVIYIAMVQLAHTVDRE